MINLLKYTRAVQVKSNLAKLFGQGSRSGSRLPDKSGGFADVLSSICRKIQFTGPMSVAQYMREVLTSPSAGYYIHRDVLGEEGDFVTSPELSQIFGELVAIWFISEWKALGCPRSFRLVELGPGRGTLAEDILRTFGRFEKLFKDVDLSLDFVEISETLSTAQHKRLSTSSKIIQNTNSKCYKSGVSASGVPIRWYRSLEDVPHDRFSFYVAHEFFDALPIHKFVRTKDGWRELFVNLKQGSDNSLEMVFLPEATIASRTLVKGDESREHVEVSPDTGAIVQNIARRVDEEGGACLIVDYGHTGDKEDTLRGFKDHKLNDIFENVGQADITADVDFSYLLDSIKHSSVRKNGPISQRSFLQNMGIDLRLMMLLRSCRDIEQKRKLTDSYKILMDEKQMGERFKVVAFASKTCGEDLPITGFYTEAKSVHG